MMQKLTHWTTVLLVVLGFQQTHAQVSGYLGKRNSFGFTVDLTPTNRTTTGSQRSIDKVGKTDGRFDFLGVHTRIGLEYAKVTKRRVQWAFGLDASRINTRNPITMQSVDFDYPAVIVTGRGIKLQVERRVFGKRVRGALAARGGIAPIGSYRGYGVRIGYMQPKIYEYDAARLQIENSRVWVPDAYFMTGQNYLIGEQFVLNQNLRIGLVGWIYWVIYQSDEAILSPGLENNSKFAKSAIRSQSGLSDFFRISLSVQLLQ